MTADDLDIIVSSMTPVVREYVTATIKGLTDRIAVLEGRALVVGPEGKPGRDGAPGEKGLDGEDGTPGENGQDGKDADPDVVERLVAEKVASLPVPRDGKDIDRADVEQMVKAIVAESVAQIPVPRNGIDGKDGASVTGADVAQLITTEVEKAVARIPIPKNGVNGQDGSSVTVSDVSPLIVTEVAKAVALIPQPEDGRVGQDGRDGKDVSAEEVASMVADLVRKAVDDLPVAKDGVGFTGALIDRDGNLILTLSDGATKDVGRVVGRDAETSEIARLVNSELEKWPKPKDGVNGKDGVDGLGFDDLKVTAFDVERRCLVITFTRGDLTKTQEVLIPVLLDRGVFTEGKAYDAGDVVSWAGAMWIAQTDTSAKPGAADLERTWRLSVKSGRDGKAGINGKDGKDGINGRDGKDLRY